jgi:hypothetical protein
MAVDQAEVGKRLVAGCTARIVRSGHQFLVVLDGPPPSGVVCGGDRQKAFPSSQHATDWLNRLCIGHCNSDPGQGE